MTPTLDQLYEDKVKGWQQYGPETTEHSVYGALYQLACHNQTDHIIDYDDFMAMPVGKIRTFNQFYRMMTHFAFAIEDFNLNPVKLMPNGDRIELPELGDLVRRLVDDIITLEDLDHIHEIYSDMDVRIGYWFSAEDSTKLGKLAELDKKVRDAEGKRY